MFYLDRQVDFIRYAFSFKYETLKTHKKETMYQKFFAKQIEHFNSLTHHNNLNTKQPPKTSTIFASHQEAKMLFYANQCTNNGSTKEKSNFSELWTRLSHVFSLYVMRLLAIRNLTPLLRILFDCKKPKCYKCVYTCNTLIFVLNSLEIFFAMRYGYI